MFWKMFRKAKDTRSDQQKLDDECETDIIFTLHYLGKRDVPQQELLEILQQARLKWREESAQYEEPMRAQKFVDMFLGIHTPERIYEIMELRAKWK